MTDQINGNSSRNGHHPEAMSRRSNGGDSPDDFELISEANFEAMLSSLQAAGASDQNARVLSHRNGAENRSNEIMDAVEIYQRIHKEHQLLKEELVSQSMTLRQRLIILEERDRQKAQEIATLNNELDATKIALNEKEIQEIDLQRQLKYFKDCSEKADGLAAKLMESDDVVKHQNAIIQQFQSDGFVSVQPPMLTDQLLAKELSQKDEFLKRLETALATVESDCLKAQEENCDLKETISELRGLVTALQSQAELDKAEWLTTRDELEQQINELVTRMSLLDPDFVAAQPRQHIITQQAHLPPRPPPPMRSENNETCPRCHFRIISGAPHPCPAIIDGLD